MSRRRRRSTGRRRTWSCRRCGTGPPSWATGAPTCDAETYREALAQVDAAARRRPADLLVRAALRRPAGRASVTSSGCRPAATSPSRADFATWADGRGRQAAADGGLLPRRPAAARRADGGRRAGRRPLELRRRQPRAAARGPTRSTWPSPWWPAEDEIDDAGPRRPGPRWRREGVGFVGDDGPRLFAATRAEALAALDHFVEHRLPTFGRYEDAMLRRRPVDGALAAVGAAQPRPARPARGGARRRGGVRRRARPDRGGRGLRPPGDGLARLHLAPLLVPRRGLPRRATSSRPRTPTCRRGSPSSTRRAPTRPASRGP